MLASGIFTSVAAVIKDSTFFQNIATTSGTGLAISATSVVHQRYHRQKQHRRERSRNQY
jgi:hypothetical protein